MKNSIFMILCLIMMTGVCGCTMKKENNELEVVSQQKIIREMETHLDEKYGYVDYEFVAFQLAGWDHPYDLLILSTSIDGVDEEFCVKRYRENEIYYCKDNYLGLVIRNDFENIIIQTAQKYFNKCKIYSELTSADGDVYPNSILRYEDIEKSDEIINVLPVSIFVQESSCKNQQEFEQLAASLVSELKSQKVKVQPRVFYLDDEAFDTLQRSNRFEYYSNKISEYKERR